MEYSQLITPKEKVYSLSQTARPAEGDPWEHIPSTSTTLSDTRSAAGEITSKMKEAKKFEVGNGRKR